jgi:hypothetical protein
MGAERTPPEATEKLDDAKGRLRAAAEEPVKREKAPASFHVFMRHMGVGIDDEGRSVWMQLTDDPVTAPNRKQAIREATTGMAVEEMDGQTFWAVPADQFQPLKRKPRQEVIDDWE